MELPPIAVGTKRKRDAEENGARGESVLLEAGEQCKQLGSSVPLNNGVHMPVFGIGTFRWKGARCVEGVRHAISRGVRLVDTAAGYNNEDCVANAISATLTDGVFVTTKVARDVMGSPAAQIQDAISRSASALGRTVIDLVLLHWPGTKNANTKSPLHRKARIAAWLALEEATKTGKVRAIGVSNFTVQHLEQLVLDGATITPAVNQVECHPYRKEVSLRKYCGERGIHVQAYTCLGRCREPPKVLYGIREPDHPRLVDDERIIALAKHERVSVPTLLLKWALQSGMSVVPRAAPHHFDENIAGLFDRPPLSEETMQALNMIEDRDFAYAYPVEKVPL